jgi:DNA primase
MATAFKPLLDEEGQPMPDATSPEEQAQEAALELRGMLNRMLIENLKAQETEAIEAAKDDPTALQRYRTLQTRRRQLELANPSTAQSQD